MQQNWALPKQSPQHLLALEAVLQQEVGQQPGDGTRLLASIIQHKPLAARRSAQLTRQRARLLVAELGREPLLQANTAPVSVALGCKTAKWQTALAVWRLLGVADPAAVARGNLKRLGIDWLDPARLAAMIVLQRLLPWRPTAAEAVQQAATYLAMHSAQRLASRLLLLQQEGALPLLVADKRAARQQWRRQRGLPPNSRAEDGPQVISLRDTAAASDEMFCVLLAQAQPERPGSSGSSSTAERYHAFMARLPQLPAYQRLLAEGAAERQRLLALLLPELVAAASREEEEEGEQDKQLSDIEAETL